MKHHDERIYRRPIGRPTLQALESQLARCRQDYDRMASKDISDALRTAMRERITALEADIAKIKRAAANEAATASEDAGPDSDPGEGGHYHGAAGTGSTGSAGTRAIPPRFRPRRES